MAKFSRYFARSPDRLGLEDVRAFQVHLVSSGISWAALNQTVCALRFFYGVTFGHGEIPERIAYAREPRKLPVVLSADEVVRFLEAVPSLKARTALTTVYAAGLRVSEGTVLTQNAATLAYIADLVPEKKLRPARNTFERAQAESWLSFVASDLHPTIIEYIYKALPATKEQKERTKALYDNVSRVG